MSAREFCVYNETRENFITPRVTVVDTRTDPLRAVKVLIEGLAPNADSGLWLKPLKSVPMIPRLSAYDLVYLDHDGCVVHGVELAPDDEAPHVDRLASSALLLPLHTFAASKIQPGDRVVFRSPDELHTVATQAAAKQKSAAPPVLVSAAATAIHPEPGAGLTKLQALAWSVAPSQAASPLRTIKSRTIPAPAPARNGFEFLRSLVHLRIRVQISITTAPPGTAPAIHTEKVAVSGSAPSPIAIRADTTSSLPSLSRQFTDLCRDFFSAVSGGITRGSSFFCRNTLACHAAYIRWADGFVFGRNRAGSESSYSIPRLGRHILDFILPR